MAKIRNNSYWQIQKRAAKIWTDKNREQTWIVIYWHNFTRICIYWCHFAGICIYRRKTQIWLLIYWIEYETGDDYGYSFIDEDDELFESQNSEIDNLELITQEDKDEWELSPLWEHLDLREYLRMREVGCLEQWADENDIAI